MENLTTKVNYQPSGNRGLFVWDGQKALHLVKGGEGGGFGWYLHYAIPRQKASFPIYNITFNQ